MIDIKLRKTFNCLSNLKSNEKLPYNSYNKVFKTVFIPEGRKAFVPAFLLTAYFQVVKDSS